MWIVGNSRPLVEKVLSRLESMSLEPVFEGDEHHPTYPSSSPENTSGFNSYMASCPDDGLTNLTLSSTNTICNKCNPDSKKRPTTQELLDELENFTTTSLKKQFDNVDQELRDQPLGTRPKQLKDNNVITKSSINVKESYAGEIRFRFTNKQLQFYNVPEP
ncbi:unnamed protein product [Rhizophagus irregularis]|nr:unnamed protein product [Rhizophagus irregularis]